MWLPQWLEERSEVSEKAKKLYAYLTYFAGGKGYAWPSFKILAEKLHCSRRHVVRLVQELSAHRLITATNVSNPERGHCANYYRFLWHPWMQNKRDASFVLATPESEPLDFPEESTPDNQQVGAAPSDIRVTCIRNSNRLWVSRWGCESLSQLRRRGPAYPQPGKVPHFLFGPFSFVNNDSQCCEQALGGSIISAPSTSLSVTRLKQSVAHPKPGRTSEPRPGATALTCEGPQMNPNRLIGALGQPGITRADRGNILDLATSMGSGPSITPKEKGKE